MGLVESLKKLYDVDRQVRGLRSRLTSAEAYFATQSKIVRQVEQDRDELVTRRKQLLAKIANLETEGGVVDEHLEKFRRDLNSSSTNKQYSAVLSELNTVKTQRGRIDDQILEEMERVEAIEEQVKAVGSQLAERSRVCEIAASQLRERKAEVGARLEELERERIVAAAEVPGRERAIFEQIAEQHDGEAMAPVEEIDRRRREFSCGACNLHMPFEQVAALMSVTETLVRCTACGRILFMQDEIRGALARK